jgi:hypothetical protein
VIPRGDHASVILPLEPCRPLERLHNAVCEALAPLIGRSDEDAPGVWQPSVTVLPRVALDAVEMTLRVVVGWRASYAWVVRDLDLVGREPSGLWRMLGRRAFGRP